MPEGDTLHNIAIALRPYLLAQPLTAVRFGRGQAPLLQGRTITCVEAIGKHLLVRCGDGPNDWVLRVHLGMHGSWHRYAPKERWLRPAWQASVVLETPAAVAVCFNASDVECLRGQEVHAHGSQIHTLGPDLLAATCDFDEVLRRVNNEPGHTPLVDIFLNQHLAAGIGNVYKSELLFLERAHPMAARSTVSDKRMREMFTHARRLMQRNVPGDGKMRTTNENVGQGRLWVYGRKSQACYACDAPIVRAVLGAHARSTYWCPRCQPETAS